MEPADARFTVTSEGYAIAEGTQHSVRISPILTDEEGAVCLTTPDGKTLRVTPMALVLADRASGATLVLGEVTWSVGVLVAPNIVLFTNVLGPDGVRASIRMVNEIGGFHSDVVLSERFDVDLLKQVGFDPASSEIQVWSAFLEAPEPTIHRRVVQREERPEVRARMQEPDVINDDLDWGAFKLPMGRAYLFDGERQVNKAVNVPKRWVQLDGQRYLVEKIPLAELEPLFAQLAPPTRDLDLESKQSVYGGHWRPRPSLQRRQGETILLAQHRTAEPGGMELIWDWEGINGSHTDKVFYGDTTYLVSDAVSLNGGNNVLQGGAVIKFAKPGGRGSPVSPRITVYGTLRCETAAYRPAVFTAKDDNSVGAVLGSGTPSGYYGGLHYLRLNQDQAGSRVLEYFRMAYADVGIGALSNYQDEFTYLYRHAQFLNCRVAIDVHDSRTAAENALICNSGQPLDVEDGDITAINCTIHNAYSMGFGYYTNCLFVDVTDTSAINEEDHNAITSGTGVFQTVQAGAHHLANGSTHRNQGTVSVFAELRSDLESMTTFPPDDRSDETISGTTVWPVFAARDDDGFMDLGYHYPAVDYLVNSVTVDHARLLLDEGVAVAAYGSMGFDLSDQGQLISLGIWCVTNHICSYQAVQEQPLVLESATPPNMTIIASSVASSPGGLQARFTHFNGMADLGGIVDVDNVAVDLRNCAVYAVSLVCDTPFAPERVEIINNLFERLRDLQYAQRNSFT